MTSPHPSPPHPAPRGAAVFALALLLSSAAAKASDLLPAGPGASTQTVRFAEMEALLKAVDGKGPVAVSVEGKSVSGRPLYAVRLKRGRGDWRALLYAQQHGDEVAGKDALLYLIRDIAAAPGRLPADLDLWIMPMVNPDGAEAGTRRNAAGADLNRDHMALEQPETQALHRLCLRVRPHVALDCHEFLKGPSGKDWGYRPVITMDGMDNPLLDPGLRTLAARWVERIADALEGAGHAFERYWVGGVPPEEEQRHSAPEIDTGLNSLAMFGGLSFIAESNRDRPLGERVAAYRTLFGALLNLREPAVAQALSPGAKTEAPAFIPTNYFWANPGAQVTPFRVVDRATGKTAVVRTPNMMTELVVKRSVTAPRGYAVPVSAADAFRPLLERHAIPFEQTSSSRTVRAELAKLERVEDSFDELYERYEGRQIVRLLAPSASTLPPGSLFIPLTGEAAARAALVLEPAQLYGLYQYPRFKALIGADGLCPVWRVVE